MIPTPSLAPISSPTLICVGGTSSLSSSGASSYLWQPGNFTTSLINVTPTITTNYTLTKSNANCTNTQTLTLVVNPLPNFFAIATPTLICAGATSTLSAVGANNYTWTSGPGFSVSGSNPVVSPQVTSLFTITASDGTCTNTGSLSLVVAPNPTIVMVASPSVICTGNSSTLSLSGANNYTWISSSLSGSIAVVGPTASTLYSAIASNSFGCMGNTSQIILVNSGPSLSATQSSALVCLGAPCTLYASGASSYLWNTGASSAMTIVNPTVTSVYTVTGAAANGCTSTQTITVGVFDPVFSVTPSSTICIGETVVLTASGAISYTWNGNVPFSTMTVSPNSTTLYFVSATSSSNGVNCVSSKTVSVFVNPNPVISVSPSASVICKGQSVTLTAMGASTYTWSNGSSLNPLQVTMSSQSLYTVTGTHSNGCIGTTSINVKINPCTGIGKNGARDEAGLVIFPNPSSGNFTISADQNVNLLLINNLGQVIRQLYFSEKNDHQVRIEDLPKGIYFISGETNNYALHQKIVVLD